jgi:hypothetical protein
LHLSISLDMLRHMRTSVDIPDPLLRQAKRVARERGTTLRQLLVDGLRSVVAGGERGRRHRMKDLSFGEGGLVDGLSWSDAERIDTLVYGERG